MTPTEALAHLGLSISATFVPLSRSRHATTWQSINWTIVAKRNGRDIITTDYAQGSGHCPADKRAFTFANGKPDRHMREKAIAAECETGRHHRQASPGSQHVRDTRQPLSPPKAEDVLYSLVNEASVLDCASFEDWCADYGYNADSIKARATYDACIASALQLRAAVGDDGMRTLREAFNDY